MLFTNAQRDQAAAEFILLMSEESLSSIKCNFMRDAKIDKSLGNSVNQAFYQFRKVIDQGYLSRYGSRASKFSITQKVLEWLLIQAAIRTNPTQEVSSISLLEINTSNRSVNAIKEFAITTMTADLTDQLNGWVKQWNTEGELNGSWLREALTRVGFSSDALERLFA